MMLLVVLLSCSSKASSSTDLGILGKVYPVHEKDLLEILKEKASSKTKEETEKFHQKLTNRAKSYATRPPGIRLPRASEYRAIAFNPALILKNDITDASGKVLFKAGTTINPLDFKPMRKTLCFVDADDPDQLIWVHSFCRDPVKNKVILVNGNYLKTTKRLGKRIYFDQRSYLVMKFGITALPAAVRQSGRLLYVEEFPPTKLIKESH